MTQLKQLGLTVEQSYTTANTRKGLWRTAHSKTFIYTLTNEKVALRQLVLKNKFII
ncbi:reverse transcriptase/maturase [Lacticaseibacillus paracasei]|uniref:reverse transcriptase/maturase n=1 Tax=Lacticaseibacillus paracasei TaxID=1597 RepID=UPI003F733599